MEKNFKWSDLLLKTTEEGIADCLKPHLSNLRRLGHKTQESLAVLTVLLFLTLIQHTVYVEYKNFETN